MYVRSLPQLLLVLFMVTSGSAQFFEFLSGLQSFIQPHSRNPVNNYDAVSTNTKTDRQSNKLQEIRIDTPRITGTQNNNSYKRKEQEIIMTQINSNINIYTTTIKPRTSTNSRISTSSSLSYENLGHGLNNQREYKEQFFVKNHNNNLNIRHTVAPIFDSTTKISTTEINIAIHNIRTNNDNNNSNGEISYNDIKTNVGTINNNLSNNEIYKTNYVGTNNNNYDNNNQNFRTNSNRFRTNKGTSNNNNYESNNSNYESNSNQFTTHNPLLFRAGVKPAPVDLNKPPMTNKPVTKIAHYTVSPVASNPGAITFGDSSSSSPPITIGPDVDQMSEEEKRRYEDLAESMCNKYKSKTMVKLEAIPLLIAPSAVEVNVSECAPVTIPLVVGGKVVTIREFPHMALVGWIKQRGGYSWKCGGSLISDQYVLTAAHCTYQERDTSVTTGSPRAVQLGATNQDGPEAVIVKVASVVRHPKYKALYSYYDIALLKLQRKVTFTDVIRPACLGRSPAVGQPVIATGWGRTEFGGDHSLELRSVSLPVWSIEECYKILRTSPKLPNGPSSASQMCAGVRKGGEDTCQGDSGGPAQVQDGCVWRVTSITSLGRSCGAANTPGVYAKVIIPFVSAVVFGQNNNRGSSPSTNDNNYRPNNQNRPSVNQDWSYSNNGDSSDRIIFDFENKPTISPSRRPPVVVNWWNND